MSWFVRVALCLLFGGVSAAAAAAEVRLWPGGPAPALELRDLDHRRHRLADYRGKVVLVNFWASWCRPCRDEMPAMQRLKARLAGKPFAVLAVNVDEPEPQIREFLSQIPVDFAILLDPGKKAVEAWKVRVLPASFIIGSDGRVRYTVVGELDWDSDMVASWVAELLPSSK